MGNVASTVCEVQIEIIIIFRISMHKEIRSSFKCITFIWNFFDDIGMFSSWMTRWAVLILRLGKGKVKVKLSLCLTKHHAMKTYWENRGIAPRILDLGTRWR